MEEGFNKICTFIIQMDSVDEGSGLESYSVGNY